MNVIFTCGGTGGHINPAIAVANILKERHSDCNILFLGAAGEMEEKLVPMAGYQLMGLPASNFNRTISWEAIKHNILGVGRILDAIKQCKKIIQEFKPDVIVGTGGYASFPALYAGSVMGIPICVHESNAVPGLTTKLIANRADRVLVSFVGSAKYYHCPGKTEVVGMPVRKEFIYTEKANARKELGLDHRPLIVSAFGSLGASEMNKVMGEMFRLEQNSGMPYQHIHATGSYGWEWMPDFVHKLGVNPEQCSGLDMREYIYNMPTVLAAADIIISRAGASSCNEIAATGTPCILIPSPNVTNNHQEKNARVLEQQGAAIVLLEHEASAQRILDEIGVLLNNSERYRQMSNSLLNMAIPDSADRICDIMEKLTQN